MQIKDIDGKILYENPDIDDIRELVEEAVHNGVSLYKANLRGADLEEVYAPWAYLEGADLSGANLSFSYLEGAYLEGANLEGASLERAYI